MVVAREAHVHSVSTRIVDDLVKALGLDGMSKSQVSRIVGELEPVFAAFSDPAFTSEHRYLWLDRPTIRPASTAASSAKLRSCHGHHQ